jgi:quercetin dioxygenase-like cupin family protein
MNLIFVILLLVFKPLVPQINKCYQPYIEVANDSIKYSLDQCFNQYSPDKVVKTSNGYQYWFVPKNFMEDGLTVKMSVVGPSKAMHAPHQHPEEEVYFILEGTAHFFLNGQTTTGNAYSSFYCPPGSEHGISNAGDGELKYLVIRKYPKTQ